MNANVANAELKIRMIQQSLRCFVFALLGLIPLIGLAFAVAALWYAGCVRVKEKQLWNAAQPFRVWGMVIASFSLIAWSGFLMILIFKALNERIFD